MGFDPAWEEELVRKGLTVPKDRIDLTLKIMGGLAIQTPSAVEALPGEGKAKKKRRKQVQHEEAFQRQVVDYAHLRGFKVAHFRRVRVQRKDGSFYFETPVGADGKGFTDLLMIRPSDFKILVAELKYGSNTTEPEQDMWLGLFAGALIPAFVWYPENWDEIEEALR